MDGLRVEASSASLLPARRGLKAVYLSGHISLLRVSLLCGAIFSSGRLFRLVTQ